jgi:hypothetical protein
MSDALSTYLHDHLAGAAYAIDLLGFMRDQHEEDDLGHFAAHILAEIEQDRDTLRHMAECVGESGRTLKETASWLGEKLSRIKLGHDAGNGLATFEALEFLEIGIHGKWALWRALAAAAPSDPRLAGFDFDALAARAQKQHDHVDHRRLELARVALTSGAQENSRHTGRAPQRPRNRRAATMQDPKVSNSPYGHSLERCHHVSGGSAMRKSSVVGSILVTLGVVVAVSMLPDLVRYLKMRAM